MPLTSADGMFQNAENTEQNAECVFDRRASKGKDYRGSV
jgi:hypothetical protein